MFIENTFLTSFLIFFFSFQSSSQIVNTDSTENLGICDSDGFCLTRFSNSPRPKGISIFQQRYLDYDIETRRKNSDKISAGGMRRNRQTEFNLRFPVILKKPHQLIMGLEYVEESFDFAGNDSQKDDFYGLLETERLRTYQIKAYYSFKFKGPSFITARASFAFSGDLDSKDFKTSEYYDYSQYSLLAIYGVRKSATKIIGIGAAVGYDFGNKSIYPILYYNKQFSDKWGIELKLPAKAELRYFFNKKNLLYAGLKLSGTSYVVKNIPLDNPGKAYLNNGNVIGYLTYEKEIYDFFWVMAEVGMRYNNSFDVSEKNDYVTNADPFIENDLSISPMIRFGIFIVPPRKLVGKM